MYFRVVALLCIVLHHSMTAYVGWPPHSPLTIELSRASLRISGLLKLAGLSSFTLIAGYFAYSSTQKYSFLNFAKKKILRILFPCFVWGGVYYLLFPRYMYNGDPVNGTHLWYLPMLFLCSMAVLCITYPRNIIVGVLLYGVIYLAVVAAFYCNILSVHSFYRPIISLVEYMPVFGFGFLLAKYKSGEHMGAVISGVIFIGSCSFFVDPTQHYISKIGFHLLFFALLMYETFRKTTEKTKWCPLWLISLDKHSFTIYLTHQFVINAILLCVSHHYISSEIHYALVFAITITGSWCLSAGLNLLQRKIISLIGQRKQL